MARAHANSTRQFPGPTADHTQQPQDRVSHDDIGRDHAEMLRRWIWRDFSNITLGLWLVASPFTLGYRDTMMIWNDVSVGLVIAVLGLLTLSSRFDLARWGLCVAGIWFFGDGTRQVLDSEISKAWPISDAGLGAVAYMLEALSGCMGGRNRWRTMPWMVLMFGFLVVPLGIVSIVLVMLQPVAERGARCAW